MPSSEAERLRRIAFVTGAYRRMRAAILGVAIGPVVILLLRCLRQEDAPGVFGAFGLLLVVAPLSIHFGGRWLDRRFGIVVNRTVVTLRKAFGPMLLGASLNIAHTLDNWSLSTGGPSVLMLALAAVALWIMVHDWAHRPHTLIFLIACGFCAIWLGAMSHRTDLLEWRMRADAVVILAWMLVGLFDLLMLTRVLAGPAGRLIEQNK